MTNIFQSFLMTAHPNNCLRFVKILEFSGPGHLTSLDEEYLVALDLLCCEFLSLYASEDILAASIFRHLIRSLVCITVLLAITIEWIISS